jgi:putative hemolysin
MLAGEEAPVIPLAPAGGRGMLAAMSEIALPSALPPRHIVDALIEERAQHLMANAMLWRAVKTVFYPLLQYRKAVEVADVMAPLGGRDAMDWASGFLGLTIDAAGVDHVPASGAAVIVANPPGGIADGVAVWDALKARRPDICYFANRDALRVCPGLEELVIPVEWRIEERSREKTRETLRLVIDAFKAGRCVVVFPAGRMAAWSWARRSLVERPWAPTAASLARKFGAPIIPLGVAQRMSLTYYSLAHVSEELKNMTVFYELLAKRSAHYRLRFSEPVAPDALPTDDVATEALRRRCEDLAWERE